MEPILKSLVDLEVVIHRLRSALKNDESALLIVDAMYCQISNELSSQVAKIFENENGARQRPA